MLANKHFFDLNSVCMVRIGCQLKEGPAGLVDGIPVVAHGHNVVVPKVGKVVVRLKLDVNETNSVRVLLYECLKGEFTFFYSRIGCPPIRGVKPDGS